MGIRFGALILICFSEIVFAQTKVSEPCLPQTWTIEKKPRQICYSVKYDARVSVECEKVACGAATLLKLAAKEPRTKSSVPTSNPGSDVCRHLKGEIQFARNERGSQIAFCEAKDGTLVDLISLSDARYSK